MAKYNISPGALHYLIDHIILPPKLPQADDTNYEHEKILIEFVIHSLRLFKHLFDRDTAAVDLIISVLENLQSIQGESGITSETSLIFALQSLPETGGIVIHVRAQNAGLLITHKTAHVDIEALELSPANETVISAKGRIRRAFPENAISIPTSTFNDEDFQTTIAQTISKMSHQSIHEMIPQVTKAGMSHSETRDSTIPHLITDYLMSVFRAIGSDFSASTIWKNTREEVLWANAKLPWRRSPLWLLIRVTLHLCFTRNASTSNMYKLFIAFFLSQILQASLDHRLTGELIYVQTAKISQRLYKLGNEAKADWLTIITDILHEAQITTKATWDSIINENLPRCDLDISSLNPARDLGHKLAELESYIQALQNLTTERSNRVFNPNEQFLHFDTSTLPNLQQLIFSTRHNDHALLIAAFESWVENSLQGWLQANIGDKAACILLQGIIESYHDLASNHYIGNPEGHSRMVLIAVELWVACDKSACRAHALLQDYSCEVPIKVLQSLLLPSRPLLQRLFEAEEYIRKRTAQSKQGYPSILRDFGNKTSFAVQHFNGSFEQQQLKSEIEKLATRKETEKREELTQKNREYHNLMAQSKELPCTYVKVLVDRRHNIYESRHDENCHKCDLKREAGSMRIEVHEWPLSSSQDKAKATVFELLPPPAFVAWRDATTFLLQQVLGFEYLANSYPSARYDFGNDPHLRGHALHRNQRIKILSDVKPHVSTHRNPVSIPTTKESVCLKNGLYYQYFDSKRGIFTSPFDTDGTVHKFCMFHLPGEAFALQKFLSREASLPNGLEPNEVLAGQGACPNNFSLDEFKAFGTLPLGYRIQWWNILAQLAMPVLDFAKPETTLLFLQVSQQVGPNYDGSKPTVERSTHNILVNEKFGKTLLINLREASNRVGKNWESFQAFAAFSELTIRLLSLTPSPTIQSNCLDYLQWARGLLFEWVGLLQVKVQNASMNDERIQLSIRLIEVALTCINTFNVDQTFLTKILEQDIEGSIFLRCSEIVRKFRVFVRNHEGALKKVMFDRWCMLSYRMLPIMIDQIIGNKSTCLDLVIRDHLGDYIIGSTWTQVPQPFNHWVQCRSSCQNDSSTSSIHFNLFTFELLVDGKPMGQLPQAYEQHPLYTTMFDRMSLQVTPSLIRGYEFSTKINNEFSAHLGFLQGSNSNLIIHATRFDKSYTLVPPEIFNRQVPNAFVQDFVHWYHHDDDIVEFVPKKTPWSLSTYHWQLAICTDGSELRKGSMSLVSMSSRTGKFFAKLFGAVEEHNFMHLLYDKNTGVLNIELPRLDLNFYHPPKSLYVFSQQFCGMRVDKDQRIDTLIGLETKLVLSKPTGSSIQRIILIPEGSVTYRKRGYHVTIRVIEGSIKRVRTYRVDDQLNRLVDSGDLQSKLYLSYLHALTSYCLPDAFTKRTGTEQALKILGSAACFSFTTLEEEELDVLYNIARLTPCRRYYPHYLRVMQSIQWDSQLHMLSQDGRLYKAVNEIFKHAEATNFLYPSFISPKDLDFTDEFLLERDLIRSSSFRVSGFSAEDHTTDRDVVYSCRSRYLGSDRAKRAFELARTIFLNEAVVYNVSLTQLNATLWNTLRRAGEIQGLQTQQQAPDLLYDAELFGETLDVLAPLWCRGHAYLTVAGRNRNNRYRIMIWFAAMAYSRNPDLVLLQTLASFYNLPRLGVFSPPNRSVFPVHQGDAFNMQSIGTILRENSYTLHQCPENDLPPKHGETWSQIQNRRNTTWQSNKQLAIRKAVELLSKQWPNEVPRTPADNALLQYLKLPQAMVQIRSIWTAWHSNHLFHKYLNKIEAVLQTTTASPLTIPLLNSLPLGSPMSIEKKFLSVDTVFSGPAPEFGTAAPTTNLQDLVRSEKDGVDTSERLDELIKRIKCWATTLQEKKYVAHLQGSRQQLNRDSQRHVMNEFDHLKLSKLFTAHLKCCEQRVEAILSVIMEAASSSTEFKIAAAGQKAPRLCPMFFLEQLSQRRSSSLSESWTSAIVKYALAITESQRAQRLVDQVENHGELINELINTGHENWNPIEFPEALLLEVEHGLMIRPVQIEISHHMISPAGNQNSVLQLNMGEGKSTVIVPLVSFALANGLKLTRVIVSRPQSKQMFQMLVSKLGGMLNRRIYHLPFSRSVQLTVDNAQAIHRMCEECVSNRGILLLQPEHILSFKLMGVESMIKGANDLGRTLLRTQRFFDDYSRDIVDESDENFSVKFELIYTMGIQQPTEMSPDRWILILKVLELVARFAHEVGKEHEDAIEQENRYPGRFPRTRILRSEVHLPLMKRLASHICNYGLPGFAVAHRSPKVRQAILEYITVPSPSQDTLSQLEFNDNGLLDEYMRGPLLLLRGLIANGVLLFTFGSKRWRVNYGLDPLRKPATQLAVPYRAKDIASPRSEFSHPDVVIVFTALSYYYGGLSDDDLFDTFGHLLKSSQPNTEYGLWVADAPELSNTFRQLSGISLKDEIQCKEELFPALRYSKGAIDYFLSYIVFPKAMKEFPHKISSSSWDLGQEKSNITTGFSGTNDSRHLLPLDMHQLDLDRQKHTNALVLNHVLQPENLVRILEYPTDMTDSDADFLLRSVTQAEATIRVILDVGAQILEMTNLQVAKKWLHMSQRLSNPPKAAVFFNESDDLSVVDITGRIELLQVSSFFSQLGECIIFLDEAHTRGTDLRLPANYRAAVTLGASVTKDRLVQACMRMRKLGRGQSLVFIIPPEIKSRISKLTGKTPDQFDVGDVLNWSIWETCLEVRRLLPLWAVQGMRFEKQRRIWEMAGKYYHMPRKVAQEFLEPEAQTLEYRYSHTGKLDLLEHSQSASVPQTDKITEIMTRCKQYKGINLNSAGLQEEQERELSPEIEEERQIQKPPPAIAEKHSVHRDFVAFVTCGQLVKNSRAVLPAFTALRFTSAARYLNVGEFPCDLLVSMDFAKTVQLEGTKFVSDQFERPVQWILTSNDGNKIQKMVVISPFEAHHLLPDIMKYKQVTLHIYLPRTNPELSPLDHLNLYTVGKVFKPKYVPRQLTILLNLFAGQLYFSSYKEYTEVCEVLGISWKAQIGDVKVMSDGFIIRKDKGKQRFENSPVAFLKVLMATIRRNCESIEKTHVGRMLQGEVLEESEF